MISRILQRLAIVWVVAILAWGLILDHNVPGAMAHGGWAGLAVGAFVPAALVGALAWVFSKPRR